MSAIKRLGSITSEQSGRYYLGLFVGIIFCSVTWGLGSIIVGAIEAVRRTSGDTTMEHYGSETIGGAIHFQWLYVLFLVFPSIVAGFFMGLLLKYSVVAAVTLAVLGFVASVGYVLYKM